jgi:putative transposase
LAIKTLELPLLLTLEQRQKIEFWFTKLKNVWNIGLARVEELDDFTWLHKETKKRYLRCPINWQSRPYWIGEDGLIIDKPTSQEKQKAEKIWVPLCHITAQESRRHIRDLRRIKTVVPAIATEPRSRTSKTTQEWLDWSEESGLPVIVTTSRFLDFFGVEAVDGTFAYHSCPLPRTPGALLLKVPKVKVAGGLDLVIKAENLAYRGDQDELLDIPYKFRAGMMKALSVSWQEFDKSRRGIATNGIKRGRPHYKNHWDKKVKTLIHANPKGVIRLGGNDTLKGVPYFGTLKVPGIDRRWRNPDGSIPEILTFKICKEASGWYVQLTGDLSRSRGIRPKTQGAIAGVPGLHHYISFDDGQVIANPNFWHKQESKIARLQQQLAHKKCHNLILWLNHPDRCPEDVLAIIRINPIDAQAILHAKTEQEGQDIIGVWYWEKLLRLAVPPSRAVTQLTHAIALQHERVRRMRRSFAHRLSTWLVRNYEVFVCADGLQSQHLRHRPPMRLNEHDIAIPNQRSLKVHTTKSLVDAAHGQLMELAQSKFKEAGRLFIRFPHAETRHCPICLTKDKNQPTDINDDEQIYYCHTCNWHSPHSQREAIVMLVALHDQGEITLDRLSSAAREAIAFRQDWLPPQQKPRRRRREQ